MNSRSRQNGVALLTAMLIVALATVAAVAMTRDQFLNLRRVENLLNADQAYVHALGVESWGRGMLARDSVNETGPTGGIDSLNEAWNQPLPQTEVDGGFVRGYIEDLQGRFNVNNLYLEPSGQQAGVDQQLQIQFMQRLLRRLELDPALAQKIADWLDADVDVRYPDGAEDLVYMRADPPYRAGNVPMRDISELLLVEGVTAEVYTRLAPFLTALPEPTPLNVNTAKRELLAALSDELDENRLDAALAARQQDAFASPDAFLTAVGLTPAEAPPSSNGAEAVPAAESETGQTEGVPQAPPPSSETTSLLGVASSYFMVHAETEVDRIGVQLDSTVFRDARSGPRVIARIRTPY